MNAYLTVHDFIRATTGQEYKSILGNLFKLTSAVIASATSIPVTPNTTVQLNANDPVTIFDGSSTEVVYVASSTASGASSIPIAAPGFAFGHAQYTSGCSDGSQGSLAEAILEGSAEVERICRQPLLQATYTNETLDLLTTRAWIDSSMTLGIRPRQFPIISVSAVSLLFLNSVMNLNLSNNNLMLNSNQRLFKVSPLAAVPGNGNTFPWPASLDQTTEGQAQLTYVAGFVYTQLPYVIKRAATLLSSDILGDRSNPTGAAEFQQGKLKQVAYLRGDMTGESANIKRARQWLQPYTQDAW